MISSSIPAYFASVASSTAQAAAGGFGATFLFAIDYMSTPNFQKSSLYEKVGLSLALPVALAVTTVAGGVLGFVSSFR